MPSPVIQIRIPTAELDKLRFEAECRGKQPSVLAREILVECLNGPGRASVGRLAAQKAVLQKERKPRKTVVQDQTAGYVEAIKAKVPYEGPKPGGRYQAKPQDDMSQGRLVSVSERLRQMREKKARSGL